MISVMKSVPMIQPRIPEKDCTTLGRAHAEDYDRMQADLREKGWLETDDLLRDGIRSGIVLEVGSGPGHLGLDWLLRSDTTRLVGLDLNPEMVAIAGNHAQKSGLAGRAEYLVGSAAAIPFPDHSFDAVISSHSLHEWLDPVAIFNEFWRVLKSGGRLYVSDLRRDLPRSARNFLVRRMTSGAVLESLRASIDAAYTTAELTTLLGMTELAGCEVIEMPLGLRVTGIKPS